MGPGSSRRRKEVHKLARPALLGGLALLEDDSSITSAASVDWRLISGSGRSGTRDRAIRVRPWLPYVCPSRRCAYSALGFASGPFRCLSMRSLSCFAISRAGFVLCASRRGLTPSSAFHLMVISTNSYYFSCGFDVTTPNSSSVLTARISDRDGLRTHSFRRDHMYRRLLDDQRCGLGRDG